MQANLNLTARRNFLEDIVLPFVPPQVFTFRVLLALWFELLYSTMTWRNEAFALACFLMFLSSYFAYFMS
jgi:hypothetical protein